MRKDHLAVKKTSVLEWSLPLIISAVTLCNGGFFSWVFVPLAIVLIILLFVYKDVVFSPLGTSLLGGITLLYFISTVFGQYDKAVSVVETVKIIVLLASFVIGFNISKDCYMKAGAVSALCLAVIGLVSLCEIVQFTDFVYVLDATKRLQSTMQYSNSAAVIFIIGLFSIRYLAISNKYRFWTAVAEVILTVSLLHTRSKIAIFVYVLLLVFELFAVRKNWMFTIAQAVFSGALFLLMSYLFAVKLSFVAFLLLLIAVPLVCELTIKIKPGVKFKVNKLVLGTVLLLLVISTAVVLRYTDISTFMIRLLYYKDGLSALALNPLLGLSPGGWADRQFEFQTAQYFVKYVHNGFLQIGLDAGVVSLILFTTAVLLPMLSIFRTWLKGRDSFDLYLVLILSAKIIHGFFDFDFSFANILMLLGMGMAFGYKDTIVVKLVGVKNCICIIISVFLVYIGVSEALYNTAKTAYAQEDYSAAQRSCQLLLGIRPYDAGARFLLGAVHMKLDDTGRGEQYIQSAYDELPFNSTYLTNMMNMAHKKRSYPDFIYYYNQLVKYAPMQKTTYIESLAMLKRFYSDELISDEEYRTQGLKIRAAVDEANARMSNFKQYLDHDARIILE